VSLPHNSNSGHECTHNVDHPSVVAFVFGANLLLARAPVASRALASRLAQEATHGKDGGAGMSVVASRLHCGACGALLCAPGGSVRVVPLCARRGRRARRGTADAVRNRVIRTCGTCGAANSHDGVRRGVCGMRDSTRSRDEPVKSAAAEATTQEMGVDGKGKRGVKRPANKDVEVEDGEEASGKKKRKKKKKVKRDEVGREIVSGAMASSQPSGIAASFLFEPL
jgi:hypothetical protein